MVTELLVPRPRIIIPKPKSYIKLDMAFGVGEGTTLFDKSRYRSHGTISGASWAAGLHGYALDFVATVPDYVEIPASYTQLNFTSEAFSIIARFRLDSLTGHPVIFCRGLYQTDGYRFLVVSYGALRFDIYRSGVIRETESDAGQIALATWYTLGLSRDGNTALVYKNGVDISSYKDTLGNPTTSARSAKIGINDDKINNPLDGKVEFLRVFGGLALSASEHLAYHNALA